MPVRNMVPQRRIDHAPLTVQASQSGPCQAAVPPPGTHPDICSDTNPARRLLSVAVGAILAGLLGISLVSGATAGAIAALAGLSILLLALQIGLLGCAVASPTGKLRLCDSETSGVTFSDPSRPRPVFSVHIPTHNEPPALVIASLRALALQASDHPSDVPDHEVIVLDNNTVDPALWEPVAAWCKAQGHPFRFVHRMGVSGAKAGALNIALELTDPAATHVIIIDADYQVSPGFLALAGRLVVQGGAALWQFPQWYRNADLQQNGVALELGDYFFRHAQGVAHSGAMLPTGTLSIIDRSALRAVGNWSHRTKTEDVELGLRLLGGGFRTRFIPQVVGTGLLPLDLAGLRIQRRRWAGGNIRALWLLLTGHPGSPGPLLRRDWVPVVRQLTAWANLTLPATAVLLITGFGLTLSPAPGLYLAAYASAACLILSVAAQTLPLWRLGGWINAGYGVRLTAIATRIALMPVASLETLIAVLPRPQVFAVTPKSLCPESLCTVSRHGLVMRLVATGAELSAAAAVAGLLWLLIGPGTAAAATCLAAVLWLATLTATETMEDYARTIALAPVPVFHPAGGAALRQRRRLDARSARRFGSRRSLARHTQSEGTS